jgi:hypothetical protein
LKIVTNVLAVAAMTSITMAGTFELTQAPTQTVLPSGGEDFNTSTWRSPGILEVFTIKEVAFEQMRIPALYGNWWTADGPDGEVRHSDDRDQLFNLIGIEFTNSLESLDLQAYSSNGVFMGLSGGIRVDLLEDERFVGSVVVTMPKWTDNQFPEWVTITGEQCSTFDQVRFYTPNARGAGDPILDNLTWAIACPTDVNGDRGVGFADLLAVLNAWGSCGACPADVNCSGNVGFDDLTEVLNTWGPCG